MSEGECWWCKCGATVVQGLGGGGARDGRWTPFPEEKEDDEDISMDYGDEEGVTSTIPMSRDLGFRKGEGTGGLLSLTGLMEHDIPRFRALRGR